MRSSTRAGVPVEAGAPGSLFAPMHCFVNHQLCKGLDSRRKPVARAKSPLKRNRHCFWMIVILRTLPLVVVRGDVRVAVAIKIVLQQYHWTVSILKKRADIACSIFARAFWHRHPLFAPDDVQPAHFLASASASFHWGQSLLSTTTKPVGSEFLMGLFSP